MDCNIKQRSEVTRLTKTIQHRQLDNAIRDIADLIGCVGFLDGRFDNLSFLDLTDTPTDYSGKSGYQVVVNGTEDGLTFVAPGGGADGNTWDITNAAFVDPVNGNNGTAVVGDGNKPYSSISTALSNSDFVILKPGNYNQTMFITTDNKHIHAMAGVTITANGVYVFGGGVNNFRFSGKAVFNGFSAYILRMQSTNAVIDFEFAYALDCNRICFLDGSNAFGPKVKMSADFIRCNCFNGGGYAVRLIGQAEYEFNIKHYVESQHDLWHARSNYGTSKLTVNCPESRIIDNYTTNYGNTNRSVVRLSDFANAINCVINGDCISTYSSTINGKGVIIFDAMTNAGSFPIFTLNGNIISDNQSAIVSRFLSSYGEFNFNGDVICKSNVSGWASYPLQTQLPGGGAGNQIFRFNGSIIQGATRMIIGRGRFVYFKDCTYYNSDVGGTESAFFLEQTGTTNQEVYLYNCSVETDASGVTPELFKGNAVGGVVGTINTTANVNFGVTYTDIWGTGYAAIPNFIVPKF